MSKKAAIWLTVVVVVVLVGGGVALMMANNDNNSDTGDTNTSGGSNSDTNTNSDSNSNDSNSSGDESNKVATNTVTIQNFAFSPANITVKKGTTVTWTNNDGMTHDVTETDGKTGPGSGNLADGKSYSFTYDTVGTFSYHCSIHPNMVGTVTVTE